MKELLCLLLVFTAVPARPSNPTQKSDHADRIVILKSKRTLTLYQGEKVLRTYQVALGTVPIGPKQMHGDHKTPEGNYRINARNAHSHYHLGLHISYPNAIDRKNARRLAVSPGGDIMIHGLPPSYAYLGALHRQTDWTDGCIAVTDQEIEEIWQLVPVGTVVEIRP
jgi:murein L,D-transpeptidase YafK